MNKENTGNLIREARIKKNYTQRLNSDKELIYLSTVS